jgi:hypothetical protein
MHDQMLSKILGEKFASILVGQLCDLNFSTVGQFLGYDRLTR